jgi:heavy-metal exporter, HME family
MFDVLVQSSLRNRVLVAFASLVLIVFGGMAVTRLPVDVLPDLNKPTVTIMTEAGGMAPPEVEALISQPLENAMSGIPGVERVRSISGVGLSVVYVEFGWTSDILVARQQVSERLALAREAMGDVDHAPQMGPVTSIMGEIMLVAIPYGDADPKLAREIADFQIRPRLLTIPGVAQVIPIGGEVRQFRIAPDTARMAQLGVSLQALEAAVTGFARNEGGGFVDQNGQEFVVRAIARTTKLEALAGLPVTTRTGSVVPLSTVAAVDFSARFRRGDAGYRGAPAVVIGIQKQPGADTVAVTEAVETGVEGDHRDLARRDQGRPSPDAPGRLHRGFDRYAAQGDAGGYPRGRHRAVCVPLECAHYGHLAGRAAAVDPDHRAGVQGDGADYQHHDAGGPGDCRRRTRR